MFALPLALATPAIRFFGVSLSWKWRQWRKGSAQRGRRRGGGGGGGGEGNWEKKSRSNFVQKQSELMIRVGAGQCPKP